MDYKRWPSLPAMFLEQAARLGDRPFLWLKRGGSYRSLSWRQVAEQVGALSRGLLAMGIARGDRVALIAENRPEWMIADLAIMATGAITVGGYTTNTIEGHRHILANSGARAVIVSTMALCQRVIPAADQISGLEFIITMDAPTVGQLSHAELHEWSVVLERGAAIPGNTTDVVRKIARADIACLLYTSGTGGVPKGVMTTHGNILANCFGAHELVKGCGLDDEVFLSFLPLWHSYEHTVGMMFPISIAAQIYFAEGAETLSANLLEARPTFLTAVPRVYELLHQRIVGSIEQQSAWRRRLFSKTLELGGKRYDGAHGLGPTDRLLDLVLERLVRDKVRAHFGGRLKAMISGAAPLSPEIGRFFVVLGLNLLQGYGQTEASPIITCNPPERIKVDTVGPPLAGVSVCIAEDREILARGDSVMKGYWNDPEATASTVRDGWLYTGDIGKLDGDGFLTILDRKRDFIKTSGGDMISPARVESHLCLEPEIAQAMVYGDRHPYLVAVVVPAADLLASFAKEHGRDNEDPGTLAGDPELHRMIGMALGRVACKLAPSERVRRVVIATEPFSIANGQMTATFKIKRHAICSAYEAALRALYESRGTAA